MLGCDDKRRSQAEVLSLMTNIPLNISHREQRSRKIVVIFLMRYHKKSTKHNPPMADDHGISKRSILRIKKKRKVTSVQNYITLVNELIEDDPDHRLEF
ncbi:hypothetical protein NQ318_007670 [Aromia moschata]|uniref:Uncharacterized protein n=1 Tax=Aromia moschata TaxID=1265417 RepID=A0AAV8XK39_9CUCU|nr:hypothetical protein NQ318_007670 [Aromia moschata]